jgi:uncharacterized membrane protein
METRTKMTRPIDFLVLVILLQASVDAVSLLDIPVARQILIFFYLTFVPGFLLIQAIGSKGLGIVEVILFSVGLSVALSMFLGLITNFFFYFGVSKPLTQTPLLIVMNGFILTIAFVNYMRGRGIDSRFKQVFSAPLKSLLLIALPVMGAAGAVWTQTGGSNSILLLMIIAIALVFGVLVLTKNVSDGTYVLAVFLISTALLFHSSLASPYIYGTDIHDEVYIFKTSLQNSFWNSSLSVSGSFLGRENSMLSVTILPVIYSVVMNADEELIMKVVYPLIFSFVPVCLYKLWSSRFEKKTALVSAFLLMAQVTFFTELLGVSRQMIGELFFILLFLVIFNKKLSPAKAGTYFILFGFSLIVSHYALAVIFLSFIFVAWLYPLVFKKASLKVTISMVFLFLVMMFCWYIYVSSSSTFDSILFISRYVTSGIRDFFDPASRGADVMRGLGVQAVESSWQLLSRIFAYLTEIFIVVGFVGVITRFRKTSLDKDYVIFSTLSMALLLACIILPRFASTLNMTRFYHIVLFFLAPFFVLGCTVFVGFLVKKRRKTLTTLLVVSILIPYFLFQTGFVYEVVGDQSWSVPLSRYRMDPILLKGSFGYVDGLSVAGAQWLLRMTGQNSLVYADGLSASFELRDDGMFDPRREIVLNSSIFRPNNSTRLEPNVPLFMSQLNVIYGKILGINLARNSSDFADSIAQLDKIYSNGECDVYLNSTAHR